jgi:hypothetical protein
MYGYPNDHRCLKPETRLTSSSNKTSPKGEFICMTVALAQFGTDSSVLIARYFGYALSFTTERIIIKNPHNQEINDDSYRCPQLVIGKLLFKHPIHFEI